jgi:spore coat polysaccharide biosynthesis predicted glycosyltransferase SpsG
MIFKILAAARDFSENYHLDIVLGSFFTEQNKLNKYLKELVCRIRVWRKILPAEVLKLMKRSDLAILSYGRSLDEVKSVGLPAIVLSSSPLNHAGSLAAEKEGGAVYLGDFRKITREDLSNAIRCLLKDARMRKALSARGRKLIDGRGTERVAKSIQELINA